MNFIDNFALSRLRDCIFQKDEDTQLLVDENQQMRDEIYQLKVDLMEQERQLRNELVQDFEVRREKRAKDFEKRLEQAKIWAEKPLLRKVRQMRCFYRTKRFNCGNLSSRLSV
jgi:predicted RNase H-like nuclease (RuvC/YqgF family)